MDRYHVMGAALLSLAVMSGSVNAREEAASQFSAHDITAHRCGGCHAIGMTDSSRNPAAPPLRDMFKRYPVYALDDAFARGLEVGHRDMPRFVLSPDERAAIIAYLDSLNPCAKPSADDAAMERCFSHM